jgi:hypothetical protein
MIILGVITQLLNMFFSYFFFTENFIISINILILLKNIDGKFNSRFNTRTWI